ncbi:MAG TPA: hypothetical protein VMT18_10665 [Planctomycetota bacterium]|nr:hypothetical protein [Planctomycetota bacterium]
MVRFGRWGFGGLLAVCATALAPACTTTTEVQPVGLELNRPVHGQALRAWRLFGSEGTLGYAVEFGSDDARDVAARTVYSVRNPWQQELGTIDGLGRAWRFQPHQAEALWLVTGTLGEGVRAILDAPLEARLEELPLALLEGSATPSTEASR